MAKSKQIDFSLQSNFENSDRQENVNNQTIDANVSSVLQYEESAQVPEQSVTQNKKKEKSTNQILQSTFTQ